MRNNRIVSALHSATVVLATLIALPLALDAQRRPSLAGRVAIVDTRVLLDSAPSIRDAETAYAFESTKARSLVADAADSLKRAVDAFSRESEGMSPARREATLLVLRAREISFEDMVRQLELLGETRRRELRQPAEAEVQTAIAAVRRREGIAVVLDRAAPGILDLDDTVDITALVAAELRKGRTPPR